MTSSDHRPLIHPSRAAAVLAGLSALGVPLPADPAGAADFPVVVVGPGGAVSLRPAAAPHPGGPADDDGWLVAELAVDTDFEFFLAAGGTEEAVVAEVEALVEACSTVFEAGPGIALEIAALVVRTGEPDPYGATGGTALLAELKSEWTTTQADVPRDLVHLFTGKSLQGGLVGLASIGAVCDPGQAFSLTRPGFTADFDQQVAVTCKELARVFGAPSCDGEPDCGILCSGLGGCSGELAFGASTSEALLESALQAGCIEPAAPTPSSAPPGLGAPPATAPDTPFVWGLRGVPGDLWALVYQVDDRAVLPAGAFDLLARPALLEVGALDAAGRGRAAAVAPALGGAELLFQLWTFDGATLELSGASAPLEVLGV